jgi:hypothetical protein
MTNISFWCLMLIAGMAQAGPATTADADKLRWAVFGQTCPVNPGDTGYKFIRQNCYHTRTLTCGGKTGCLCQTDKGPMPGEIAIDSMPDCAYRRVGVCRWRDAQSKWIIGVQVRPVGWTPPVGMTCVVIVNRLLVIDSRAGQRGQVENAPEAQCGWPVESSEWACCPHCLVWGANGCPPCAELCKYNNSWPGHEAECAGSK